MHYRDPYHRPLSRGVSRGLEISFCFVACFRHDVVPCHHGGVSCSEQWMFETPETLQHLSWEYNHTRPGTPCRHEVPVWELVEDIDPLELVAIGSSEHTCKTIRPKYSTARWTARPVQRRSYVCQQLL